MAINEPLFISTDVNLHTRRNTDPAYGRIIGVDHTGVPRPTYGCGWNVLAALSIVTRDEAQARTNQIVTRHAYGLDDAGLMTGTMIELITARFGIVRPLHRTYYRIPAVRNAAELQTAMQQLLLPANDYFRDKPGQFFYSIVKYVLNEATGLGHTITLAFERQPDNSFNVFTFDVQLNRYYTFSGIGAYLTAHPEYVGVSTIVLTPAGGRRKSGRKRKSKKTRRSMKKGGLSLNDNLKFEIKEMDDPELYPMNDKDDSMYVNLIDKIENEPTEMYKDDSVYKFK
jgi:hypothetical protein